MDVALSRLRSEGAVSALRRDAHPAAPLAPSDGELCDVGLHEGELGTSRGVNISPGSDDDGWIVPDPVVLGDGTQIQLYKDGEALHAAYEAIERARYRICLESYIFADDDTGRAFAELLCRQARKGIRVYVIYDAFGSFGVSGLWRRRPPMFRHMQRAGVKLQEFHPFRPWRSRYGWRPVNRDHRKLLVIDDDIAGLGGLNVGAEYAGSWVIAGADRSRCELWRDNAVGVRGPAARKFLKAFGNTWNYCVHGGRLRRAEYVHELFDGELGILASVPTIKSPLRKFLCHLMGGARDSLYMTMAYFVPDDELVEELCKIARRGVRVRLMLPGRCDVPLVQIAARGFYEKLMGCGIEIYERQAVVLHSKTMVIDGHTTMVGSTNLDYRSIEYNFELSAVIRNATFGQQMQALFENDVRFARRMTLAEWRRRPTWDRFVQWAVSRVRYVL